MKNQTLTTISTLMLFIPWTILLLRTNTWALESPAAEVIIYIYAGFMIFSGIFTSISYVKTKAQSNLMKLCLMVNLLYAIVGAVILGLMIIPKII